VYWPSFSVLRQRLPACNPDRLGLDGAGHSSDAAGATAGTDNSHALRTALPCPAVDGRVLS